MSFFVLHPWYSLHKFWSWHWQFNLLADLTQLLASHLLLCEEGLYMLFISIPYPQSCVKFSKKWYSNQFDPLKTLNPTGLHMQNMGSKINTRECCSCCLLTQQNRPTFDNCCVEYISVVFFIVTEDDWNPAFRIFSQHFQYIITSAWLFTL